MTDMTVKLLFPCTIFALIDQAKCNRNIVNGIIHWFLTHKWIFIVDKTTDG